MLLDIFVQIEPILLFGGNIVFDLTSKFFLQMCLLDKYGRSDIQRLIGCFNDLFDVGGWLGSKVKE